MKKTRRSRGEGRNSPPRGVFGFICTEDVGHKDKNKLGANGPKKKTHRSSPSLDATDCQKSEWHSFQTRPSSTDDADLMDVKKGRCGRG